MCDVAMFGAGKKSWAKEVQRWKIETNNAEFDEVTFVKILKKVNDAFIKKESIINGFKVTGIQPFNVENVLFDRCIGFNHLNNSNSDNQNLTVTTNVIENEILEPESAIEPEVVTELEAVNEPEAVTEPEVVIELEAVTEPETTLDNVIKIMKEIENKTQSIVMPYVAENHPNLKFTMIYFNQLLKLMTTEIKSSLDSGENSQEAQDLSLQDLSQTSSLLTSSISNVLVPPKPFQRSGTYRTYKALNYGVMTSNKMTLKFKEIEDSKQKAEEAKVLKKVEREERKKQNEIIRNMKKENVEA